MTTTPPGWYTDPENAAAQRWWDGTRWTEFTSAWAAAPDARPAPPASALVIFPTPALPANSAPAKPWRPTTSTIIVAAVAFVASVIVAVTGGIGAFLVSLSLFGLGASIYVLVAKRPSFLNLAPTRRAGGTALGVSAAVLLVGALLSPLHPTPPTPVAADNTPVAAASTPTPAAAAPKKSSTPTPAPVVLTVYAGRAPSEVLAELAKLGLQATLTASDGSSPGDWTGWTIVDQSPVAGSGVAPGTAVILTLTPPAPPVIEPAPEPAAEPAPAEPEPVTVAPDADPAPAPEPPAEEAPAAADTITPGAFCPDDLVGAEGTAANGRTYICGGKGPDANGHYHWNVP